MTAETILKAFDVTNPKPHHQAMAEYLSQAETAIQTLTQMPDADKEKRKRIGLALLELIEQVSQQDIPMDSTPADLINEARWRIGDNV